ncbi:putative negative acting factor [Metarhizium anisopliae]|nr:putative negative acting factor [Metarhizium anisopliae]
MSSCDSIDDGEWDSFGDSGKISSKSTHEKLDLDLRLSTSTMQLVARQEDPERTPVPTPPDANRLQFLFSKYENLVNRQRLVPHELQGSPVENDESPRSNHPESGHQAIPHPLVSAAREQKRGISKRKTQRQKKGASRSPSRTKRALASTIQEYEYMQLGEARKAPNGSIEVEVFWAPIFLPCDQLRGEQAIEEAKDLVVRKFGQVAWEMERTKFGCVGTKKR